MVPGPRMHQLDTRTGSGAANIVMLYYINSNGGLGLRVQDVRTLVTPSTDPGGDIRTNYFRGAVDPFQAVPMSDVLKFISGLDPADSLQQALTDALVVINGALHVYTPREIVFSFNGGKDSTVVLHCLRAACEQRS